MAFNNHARLVLKLKHPGEYTAKALPLQGRDEYAAKTTITDSGVTVDFDMPIGCGDSVKRPMGDEAIFYVVVQPQTGGEKL